jgi:hypothetical protein
MEEAEMRQIRQGDVLLVREESTPNELRRRHRRLRDVEPEAGRLVLARGEATGHAHVIEGEGVALVSSQEAEELYVLIHGPEPAALVHEEHDTLPVEPGVYRVVRQREYREPDPWVGLDGGWDFVRD